MKKIFLVLSFIILPIKAVIIETEDLILRNWKQEDIEIMYQIVQDTDVNQFLLIHKLNERSIIEKWITNSIKSINEKGYGYFACEEKKSGKLIGFAGLNYITLDTPPFPCYTISVIGEKSRWGKGYAQQAGRALLKYGFEVLKLDTINACAVKDNIKSKHAMEKLNLKYVCEFDFPGIDKNHPHCKHIFYTMTKDEYFASRD